MIKILKFGGSSVGSAEALRRAAAIVHEELPAGGLVVVSALKGTTDRILEAAGAERESGWAVVALVGEGLRADPVAALRHLAALGHEPVGGLLTGSSTVSVAFLVPESRLGDLIPRLHDRCVLRSPEYA